MRDDTMNITVILLYLLPLFGGSWAIPR